MRKLGTWIWGLWLALFVILVSVIGEWMGETPPAKSEEISTVEFEPVPGQVTESYRGLTAGIATEIWRGVLPRAGITQEIWRHNSLPEAGVTQEARPEGAEPLSELDSSDIELLFDEWEIELLALVAEAEAGGVKSMTEKSAVMWTAMNRLKSDEFPNTLSGVLLEKYQYAEPAEVASEETRDLALDVALRYSAEKSGTSDVGRTLPEDYLWFYGDGAHNHFYNDFEEQDAQSDNHYHWGSFKLTPPYYN